MMSKVKLMESKLAGILGFLEVSPEVKVEDEDGTYTVSIKGADLSFLIGYRGESLNALQSILAMMLFKESSEWQHVVVDINGYREERQNKIEDMARSFIDKVRFHGDNVEMPAMSSFERRQVHMFVSDYPDIVTESIGEGRSRRIVLKLKE